MKLTDTNILKGKTETVTCSDLRTRIGDVLTQVQMGKQFSVTKCGKEIAVISPREPNAFELGAAARKVK